MKILSRTGSTSYHVEIQRHAKERSKTITKLRSNRTTKSQTEENKPESRKGIEAATVDIDKNIYFIV